MVWKVLRGRWWLGCGSEGVAPWGGIKGWGVDGGWGVVVRVLLEERGWMGGESGRVISLLGRWDAKLKRELSTKVEGEDI